MSWADFDTIETHAPPRIPAPTTRDWSIIPTLAELRDYRLVLTDARPRKQLHKHNLCWVAGSPDWQHVDPPNGVIPRELWDDIVFLCRFTYFETLAGAMAALETVVMRRERGLTRKDG